MNRLLLVMALWIAVFIPIKSQAPIPVPSSRFSGSALPMPPQQSAPWTPSTAYQMPKLISAAQTLFTQGLADPRGCDYREIQVVVGDVLTGTGTVVTVHGWVLPEAPGISGRFAVCWNGLVTPVVAVGAAASLESDMKATIKAEQDRRVQEDHKLPRDAYRPTRFVQNAISEEDAVSPQTFSPIKACLLLRIGEAGLAKQFWDEWLAVPSEPTIDAKEADDPYLLWASDWTWALFDRAVGAHQRGDDELARRDAHVLVDLQPQIEAEAKRRNYPQREAFRPTDERKFEPYLTFLDQVPELAADQDLRANQSAAVSVTPQTLPDQTARIHALILNLDQVGAHQNGQSEGGNLRGDPIVEALVAQGDHAVEPLLHVMEEDDRLTRSVTFFRTFYRGREIVSVAEAAYMALTGILKNDEYERWPTQGDSIVSYKEARRNMANKLRAYWIANRNMTVQDRWYRILAHDQTATDAWIQVINKLPYAQTTMDAWIQAANNMTQDDFSVASPHRPVFNDRTAGLNGSSRYQMQGEALRRKMKPSVTSLMAKRIMQIETGSVNPSGPPYIINRATELALDLATWDPKKALPTLQQLMRLACSYKGQCYPGTVEGPNAIVELTEARKQLGDAQSLSEYARWLETRSSGDFNDNVVSALEPLWRYPDDPDMVHASKVVFESSAWGWQKYANISECYTISELTKTPLIGIQAFQKFLLRRLNDQREAGTIELSTQGGNMIDRTLNSSGEAVSEYPIDPVAPQLGLSYYRLCDICAHDLSTIEGAPGCELYWPFANRNAAIKADKAFLQRFAGHLKYAPEYSTFWQDDLTPHLSFPRLKRPATEADVRAGNAIFALAGKARVVPLDSYPIAARWVGYRGGPTTASYFDSKTRQSHSSIAYLEGGVIWQAEEVNQGGKVTRYYGFVGSRVVAKVPATEVQLSRSPRFDSYVLFGQFP